TSQTKDEFARNRVRTLRRLIKGIRNLADIQSPQGAAILQGIKPYKEILELVESYKAKAKEVVAAVNEILNDEHKDPVATAFRSLHDARGGQYYEALPSIVQSAHQRKLRGNPPTSPKKYTIGDEIIWETLLANVHVDLVIVTADKSFLDNEHILKQEFA